MQALKAEFEKTKAADFELRFRYPTKRSGNKSRIVNRDMSKVEQERFAKKQSSLVDIIESLESGETFYRRLPEDTIKS